MPQPYNEVLADAAHDEDDAPMSPNGGTEMHALEFEEVALTAGMPGSSSAARNSAASAGGGGDGGGGGGAPFKRGPAARWVRWAAGGAATLQKKVGQIRSATSKGPMQPPGSAQQLAPADEIPEHWGLTARELGRIEKRWRLWSSAVSSARPSTETEERGPLDRLSAVPRLLAALQARGIFFGWAVAAVVAVGLVLEAPVCELSIAVALDPIGRSLGCDEADLARALAIAHVFAGLAAPVGTYALAHLAPGTAGALCAALLALGLLVASAARGLFALGFGVALAKLAGQGVLAPLAMSALHGWWRSRRRVVDTAVIVAVSIAALGVAPALVRAAALGAADGWRRSLAGGALVSILAGAPLLLLLLPRPPNAYGQMPDGVAVSAAFQGDEALEIADLPTQVWSFADAATSSKFWLAQLALVTVRVHAAGLLFMHGVLLPDALPRVDWLMSVAAGGAVAAVAVGLSLEQLRKKHLVLVAALAADVVALALAALGPAADGAALAARLWGALAGAMVSACILTPGPVWCQLFGSVDAYRIELLSACTTLGASGIAIGIWAQWYDSFGSVSRALRLAAATAAVLAAAVGLALNDEVDGSVQSWQSLQAARDVNWSAALSRCFRRRRSI
ncbi:hypothetical protein KFE25_001170 [Diacronema lutheri]|uniref:Major facilitator superfamily (MFS) profile domain-containing protein n=2 Tax=Diacronema lutheri TaxID=2081491 RepID=A0A8J5X9W0_DIALT|nr:hypothetical protein KFE25_001170 [Diacronema lutheri]